MTQAQNILNHLRQFGTLTQERLDSTIEVYPIASSRCPNARTTEYECRDGSRLIATRANAAYFDLRAVPAA